MTSYWSFVLTLLTLTIFCGASSSFAAAEPAQSEYERSIQAVVRDKLFFKESHLEAGLFAGVMPYDSVVNHYVFGGKFTWHIADHFGWEIIDANCSVPSVTSFATNDIATTFGISNLQMSLIRQIFSSNFVVSPLYGKIRFLGRSVLHFDVYVVGGFGAANTNTLQLSSPAKGTAPTSTTLRSGFEPLFDVGLGFKLFLNDTMAIVVDLRDYVVYSQLYGSAALRSNYTVYGGVSFFIPSLGG